MKKIVFIAIIVSIAFTACKKGQPESSPDGALPNTEMLMVSEEKLVETINTDPNAIFFRVSDTGVRLRDAPGVTGGIIRQLDKDEMVEFISSRELYDSDDEYKWVNVKTTRETGWVYGEFLSRVAENKLVFTEIEDIGIVMNGQAVLPGMPEDMLFAIFGEPQESFYSEIDNNTTFYYYGSQKDLVFFVYKHYGGRIYHIIIRSSAYELANGIRIGMHIQEVLSAFSPVSRGKSFAYQLRNRLRSESYDASILLETDLDGIIIEIQIAAMAP